MIPNLVNIVIKKLKQSISPIFAHTGLSVTIHAINIKSYGLIYHFDNWIRFLSYQ